MKQLLILLTLVMLAPNTFGDSANKEKMRSRLEQLFMWRVSDKLQLTPNEESKFTAEYKKLSEDRFKASEQIEEITSKLSDKKLDKKAKAKLLANYEEASRKYGQLQQSEFTAMSKIFDTDKMADYVLLKRDMMHKFRDVLSTSSTEVAKSPEKPKLKEPEVYQEK